VADQAWRHTEIGGHTPQSDGGQALGLRDLDGLGQQFAVSFGRELPLGVTRLDGQFRSFLLTNADLY
jgi:hypothetical protein